ncbi:MAG: hypothetical protein IJC83_01965 [Oscillospiraceae bacterium]|nr:hypothetical protein [Oscillospiraceae bacterium]
MGKIAFKPKKIDAKKVSYQTGNHHLFLYDINASAEILAFNIVHSGLDSLVNYVGEPIVKPFAVVDEQVAYFKRMDITYENSYIPTFKTECNDVDIQIRVIAPEEVKALYMR